MGVVDCLSLWEGVAGSVMEGSNGVGRFREVVRGSEVVGR